MTETQITFAERFTAALAEIRALPAEKRQDAAREAFCDIVDVMMYYNKCSFRRQTLALLKERPDWPDFISGIFEAARPVHKDGKLKAVTYNTIKQWDRTSRLPTAVELLGRETLTPDELSILAKAYDLPGIPKSAQAIRKKGLAEG